MGDIRAEIQEAKAKKARGEPLTLRERRIINLHIWNKGESGCPGGRELSITSEIKRALEKVPRGKKKTRLQLLVTAILEKAIKKKDVKLMAEIWRHIDGMPKQAVDVQGKIETATWSELLKKIEDKNANSK